MVLERVNKINIDELSNSGESFPYDISPGMESTRLNGFLLMENLFNAAIKEVNTRLEIIDEEFQILHSHNPIHHIESRLKSPQSITKKLKQNGCEVTPESVLKNLTDVAGIRVICYYLDEVYGIADLLSKYDDIKILKTSDYIKNPKQSGYRSLHIVISVRVYLSSRTEIVPVEIQIRTIAMDFWASLEHQLGYKTKNNVPDNLHTKLKKCAEEIASIELTMQDIYNEIKF